jgi:hypothetical protein
MLKKLKKAKQLEEIELSKKKSPIELEIDYLE